MPVPGFSFGKIKKPVLIFTSAIILIAVLFIVFISPASKYFIEKFDEKYTGRQITMDRMYVNPFTGYVYFSNLKIYELKSDSVFFSANSIGSNIAMLKLFNKTYEISNITINHPRGIIIQNNQELNFSDLIERFSSKETGNIKKASVHFNIHHIEINDGEFYYHEKIIPVNYSIKGVNIKSDGKLWDSDTIGARFNFIQGIGTGDMKGDFTINLKNLDYRLSTVVNKFDLNIINQYLKDLVNYGSFSAILDADLKVKGNFKEKENITSRGRLAIKNFHFGKDPKEDYASFDKLVMAINELSPKNHIYLFDSVSLNHPYFKYERYDYLDNLQMMFGKQGAKIVAVKDNPAKFNLIIEIADYIKTLSANFFKSDYKINRLAVYNGDLKFNDFSISEIFSAGLDPVYILADSIYKNKKWVNVSFKSSVKPFGKASVDLSINPNDSSDFNLRYHFRGLSAAMFNPYISTYTSFSLDKGTIELDGTWRVRNGIIKSDNHLLIIDPNLSKRVRKKDKKWMPMPLIMSFIRERGNVIDYEIPISGNLKKPDFHWRDAVFDLIANIFIKPPTTPYRMYVKNIETEIEKSLTLKWQMRQNSLRPDQEKFVERMAEFLVKNPDASIEVYPEYYEAKEKEYILLFEAKKRYFISKKNKKAQTFSEADSMMVNRMSVKDPLFIQYLNEHAKGATVFTVQGKSAMIIDRVSIGNKFKLLNNERKKAFIYYFKKKGVERRVKIYEGKNVIPYNGFSFYKIKYKGELPESLIRAYHKINELDEELPREKFKKEHRKTEANYKR